MTVQVENQGQSKVIHLIRIQQEI